MELSGQLTEIIYQNEVNSYLIGILENEEDTITIVGYMPFLVEGDYIKVIGNFVTHKEYGKQFKVETFEKIMPKTLDSLEKYLSNGTIKGIGPATAKKIVATFGEDTINVFKFEPEKLTQIKGITKEKAIEMAQCFVENWELWQIVGFLDNFGISPANAKTIYKKLGTQTIDEIESNPYILIDLVKGVDFAKLDKYALENGFEINNYKRIKCGIKYSLVKITYNGHCCTLEANLIKYVKELLKVEDDDIEHCLIDLNVKEEIVIEKREDENWVYSKEIYDAEANIASKLILLDSTQNIKRIDSFDSELEKIEKEIEEQFGRLQDLKEQLVKIDLKKNKTSQDLEDVINRMWEEYELTPNTVEGFVKTTDPAKTQKEVNYLRNQIRDLGSINIDSIKEYQTLKERYDFMCEQRLDLENSMAKLRNVISEMITIMKAQFKEKFKLINKNFDEVFKELFGGGKAELILENEDDVLNCGIDIRVQPPGKKLQNMTLLSGGEKAFTAIAILFAILKINPAPFCVLDEIEAALDDVNVNRYAEYLKKFSKDTQFLVITHRKGTMEAADTVYGITMEENGISKLLSMKLK